ncbi:MAG: EamA family transporter [Alphaproteobacteria bacterium]|nr:EamA family transporter [Alphaproteobacteria bacterium]
MLAVSLPTLILTLVCAAGFAGADYFRKAASSHMPPILLLTVFIVGQVPLLGAWVSYTGAFAVDDGYWLYGGPAAASGLLANLLFLMALRVSSLSLTIPVLGLVPVITTVFAAVALDEIPTTQQSVGIVLAVLGLLSLYVPPENPNPISVFRRFATDKGARLMLVVAVLWSATAPLDKASMALSSPESHGFIQVCIMSVVLIGYVVTSQRKTISITRVGLTPAMLASAAAGVAYAAQLVAYQLTLIGVVESLKRVIGLLSALLLGRIFLGEPLTTPKLIGIAFMVIGVPLIILPPLF